MKRVLVVEDEASIREMVALNLKMAGWDVVEAPSAERALELCTAGNAATRHFWILCCRAWTA